MQTFTYRIKTQCHVNPKCQYEVAWAPVFTHAVEATVGFLMDLNLSKCLSLPLSSQLLLVLVLAMPEALSAEAAVDLPVLSALLSLPFYLLCLLLASVHVLVCTSAESTCYFCSLSWGLVFAAVAFSAAMFCILLSLAARRLPMGPKIHRKVSLSASKYTSQNTGTDWNRCLLL